MHVKEELYTIEEVAKIFKVEKRTVYKWMDKGVISYVRINKKTVRFRAKDLDEFIKKHLVKNQEIDEFVDEILSRISWFDQEFDERLQFSIT